jgi:LacI family transcriptional regulator
LKIADSLNWHPHPYARGLAKQRTNSILAVVPFFPTYFFVEVLRGVQSRLCEMDYDLILYGMNDPRHVEELVKRNSLRVRVDGVLFLSMPLPDAFIEVYRRLKIPIVAVDTRRANVDSLYVQNVKGAHTATMHLLSLGHRRIGLLGASLRSQPARERVDGYRQALEEQGVEVDPELIKTSGASPVDGFSRECGYELMKELIKLGSRRPTAVFATSDIQASGALWAMEEAGLRSPDDMAIVGFDDIELAHHLRMTTIHQPMFEMGVLAARKIEERINGSQLPPANVQFVPELVIRESCGSRHHRPQVQEAKVLA